MLQSSMLAGVFLCACLFAWNFLCSLILWTCRAQQKCSNLRSCGQGLSVLHHTPSRTFLLNTCNSDYINRRKNATFFALNGIGWNHTCLNVWKCSRWCCSVSADTRWPTYCSISSSPVTLQCWGSTCSLCFARVDNYLKSHPFRLSYHILI